MGLQDIIAIGLAVLAVLYVGRKTIRTLFGQSNAGTGGCARGCDCGTQASQADTGTPSLKRIPLVTLNQVGITSSTRSTESDGR